MLGSARAQITRYNEAPSRKRVSAMLEETRSKRQKLSEEEVKKALSVGKVCTYPQRDRWRV